jgi:hypothetical protein
MSDPRPPLTPKHRDLLQHFVRLVDDMSRSRFLERFRKQDHTVRFRGEDGQPQITAPNYDWDDFRSFLTTFRQVAISKNETVHVFKITKVARDYASPALRAHLDRLDAGLRPLIKGDYAGISFGGVFPSGEEISLTSPQVLDSLVNGLIFHADERHREKVAFLSANERWQYLWPLLFEVIIPMVKACIWLFHALRHDGILADSDYPARCLEPSEAP